MLQIGSSRKEREREREREREIFLPYMKILAHKILPLVPCKL
jgi:hypothetical protein